MVGVFKKSSVFINPMHTPIWNNPEAWQNNNMINFLDCSCKGIKMLQTYIYLEIDFIPSDRLELQ